MDLARTPNQSEADEDAHCIAVSLTIHKSSPDRPYLQKPQPPTTMLFNKNIALALAFTPFASVSSLRAVSFLLVSAVG